MQAQHVQSIGNTFALRNINMKTDAQLQKDVTAELSWQPSFDSANIGVSASAHVITLSGRVSHYAERTAAEAAAKGVYGVNAVANEIDVQLMGSSHRTDQDIAEAAVNALKWDIEVPKDRVKIVVANGSVTLSGSVDWQYQRDAAARCVQYLIGVVSVSNMIFIKPHVTWSEVTNDIEAAFRRNANVDARRIDVSTHDGTVTLNGYVSSWAERDQAVNAAWAAPGVKSVNDELSVAL
jgi:osmotically-inducible protein OsmY